MTRGVHAVCVHPGFVNGCPADIVLHRHLPYVLSVLCAPLQVLRLRGLRPLHARGPGVHVSFLVQYCLTCLQVARTSCSGQRSVHGHEFALLEVFQPGELKWALDILHQIPPP